MSHSKVIQVDSVSKVYAGSDFPAVNGISFDVEKNEVFGLLGPNGAGKTTTMAMLCGLIKPTEGRININGDSLDEELPKIKKSLGIVPQDIALYPSLTGRENLRFYGAMYGVPKDLLNERIDNWLVKLEMSPSADKLVKTYSGGMKRRINLIAGILHEPSILFLDEPTVGVDVQSRAAIMKHLQELNQAGTTIIYTSHHLEEAEKFCSDVAIIDNGELITRGNPQSLIDQNEGCKNLEDVFLRMTKLKLRD